MAVNGDSTLNPQTFLHFEHTDGANWLHLIMCSNKALGNENAQRKPLA
ncbi:MAG: hypothetical protein R2765_05675 [Ferruginibacter sp.]